MRASRGWLDYEQGVKAPPAPRPEVNDPAQMNLLAPVIPAARDTDPATSNEGINDVLPRAGSQQHKLLLAYGARPMGLTAEEAAELAGLNRPGVCYWKRVGDLLRHGLIEDTFQTRLASTGSAQRVCAITSKGRRAVR